MSYTLWDTLDLMFPDEMEERRREAAEAEAAAGPSSPPAGSGAGPEAPGDDGNLFFPLPGPGIARTTRNPTVMDVVWDQADMDTITGPRPQPDYDTGTEPDYETNVGPGPEPDYETNAGPGT